MFVTALLAATLAAPVPKDKPAEVYFPTLVGTKRVTQTTLNGVDQKEVAEEITKVEEKDGTYTVTMEWPVGKRTVAGVFEVTPKKVRRVGVKELGDYTLLDTGVKPGETWTMETQFSGRKYVVTYTLGKEEEVEVPAGKFKAVVVTEKSTSTMTTTKWYAVGVGVVKEKVDSPAAKSVTVLKSFTPGKDSKK